MTALTDHTATELSRLIRRGELSALEVTDAYLARIAAWDEVVRAFTFVATHRARQAARLVDVARRLRRLPSSALAGVPLGIKDLYPVRLMPFRGGSAALTLVPRADGKNVARIRAAGTIIIGKLATSEFGAMPFTEPSFSSPTRSPWDLTTTAGGSSGGTGAALAAGLVPIGHGSDGGGSIRIPAAMCGVFGFKASRGALHHGSPTEKIGLSTEGPLARSVDDAIALLQVLAKDRRFAGVDPADVGSVAAAAPKGVRVRLVLESSEPSRAPVHPAMRAAAERVGRILEAQGHHVDVGPPPPVGLTDFLPLWQKTMATIPVPKLVEHRLQPITRWLRQDGVHLSDDEVLRRRDSLTETLDRWWAEADIIVTPATACLPPAVGSWQRATAEESFLQAVPMAVFTAAFNASGQPAMTVPVFDEASGRPLGVQVVARRDDDVRLLALARVLEAELGGFRRRPPAFS